MAKPESSVYGHCSAEETSTQGIPVYVRQISDLFERTKIYFLVTIQKKNCLNICLQILNSAAVTHQTVKMISFFKLILALEFDVS